MMTTPLLQTKLHIPPVRAGLVPRPRLIERLNAGLGGKLSLISAPAGFGKTTLLSQWAHLVGAPLAAPSLAAPQSAPLRVGWVSLDEGDNDPARFWAYFIAALQRVQADIGEAALAALQSPQSPPIEALLTGLINELAGTQYPFALVLDDFHVINALQVNEAVTFLLDNLPPQMLVVLSTRSDPPLALARLRARGQLTELRAADLRFSPDEASAFLNDVMGLELSAENIAALDIRTEGWIAGLQMAALSMQGRKDATTFIRAFSGSHRFVLDYLVEEVLDQQSPTIQDFLLKTSVLERMSSSLCDAVTDRNDSQTILSYLEQANLFLVPLDDERRWYRYHHLFADLLHSRLEQSPPSIIPAGGENERGGMPALHRRASEWYELNGLVAAAIDHALSAGDFERAAHLIGQIVEVTLMRSEIGTFLSWVERLPDELVRDHPSLCLFHAWALLLSGRPLDAIDSRLQDVDKNTAHIPGEAAVLLAFVAAFRGQVPLATELSRQALEQLPEDGLLLRSVAVLTQGITHLVSGDVAAASQALEEAARVSREIGNVMVAVVALCQLAELCMIQGQLHKATATYQQALELATNGKGRPRPIAGMALIGLGELLRERNDLSTATNHLEEGIELAARWGEIGALDGYIALARVKQAQGDEDGARNAIQKAQQLAVKFDATELDDALVAAHQARLWVAQGNLEAAARWAALQECDPAKEDRSVSVHPILQGVEQSTFARLLIAQGRFGQATDLLEPLLQRAESAGWTGVVIEILTLQALALQGQGRTASALPLLHRALSLAEPEGYVRVFVDEGAPMSLLLQLAAARDITVEYVVELLAALEKETKEAASFVSRRSSLVEPLSERELEVLRLITAGLSNREIAEELFIAVSTVKTHINNIYGKLDVSKRTQAVARARELNLL